MKKSTKTSRVAILFILTIIGIYLFWIIQKPLLPQSSIELNPQISEKCISALEETQGLLTVWMSGRDSGWTVEELFSRLHYSEDFILDTRQRRDQNSVDGMMEIKSMLKSVHGKYNGLQFVAKDIRVVYSSPNKAILKFTEYQIVNGETHTLVYSNVYCRWKKKQPKDVEIYIQEEADTA